MHQAGRRTARDTSGRGRAGGDGCRNGGIPAGRTHNGGNNQAYCNSHNVSK